MTQAKRETLPNQKRIVFTKGLANWIKKEKCYLFYQKKKETIFIEYFNPYIIRKTCLKMLNYPTNGYICNFPPSIQHDPPIAPYISISISLYYRHRLFNDFLEIWDLWTPCI